MKHVVAKVEAGAMTVVIVEHDLELIWSYCGYVHFLSEGELLFQGPPDKVKKKPRRSQKIYGGLTMLRVEALSSGYGEVGVLENISFEVDNEIFAVLGANGAGKSTLLKTLANLLPVSAGSITLEAQETSGLPANDLPAMGISYVPQEANVFPDLTVDENLSIGTLVGARDRADRLRRDLHALPSSGRAQGPTSRVAIRRGRTDAGRRPRVGTGPQGASAR